MSEFLARYKKHILIWILLVIVVGVALKLGVDKKVVVLFTIIFGILSQAFVGLVGLIGLLPWIGPFIIKVFAIPIFWVLNAMGYFVSAVAIKKGYTKELAQSRIVTIVLLVGIILGYILGHLVPMR